MHSVCILNAFRRIPFPRQGLGFPAHLRFPCHAPPGMSLEVHGGRSFAEACILYDKAVDALGKRVNDEDSDYDMDALGKDKKILKRELEVCRKNVGPAHGPGGEGSKGKALSNIKVNTLNYDEEPTGGDFPDCKAARAALVATPAANGRRPHRASVAEATPRSSPTMSS